MKARFLITMLMAIMLMISPTIIAQSTYSDYEYSVQKNTASITFKNSSDYTMTLRIVYSLGGLYTIVSLPAHSSRTVSFSKSGTFKLKIKATKYGQSSYHDGGKFSVTCNDTEWTEGEMTFQMSSYGSGLGPSISAKEFENDK